MKDAKQKRAEIGRILFYEISRIGKSIEIESRFYLFPEFGRRRNWTVTSNEYRVFLGDKNVL